MSSCAERVIILNNFINCINNINFIMHLYIVCGQEGVFLDAETPPQAYLWKNVLTYYVYLRFLQNMLSYGSTYKFYFMFII